jgi:hypothetical protein
MNTSRTFQRTKYYLLAASLSCLLPGPHRLMQHDACAQGLVPGKNQPDVMGYKDTAKLPWCGYCKHDPDRPLPPIVTPADQPLPTPPPSDAIVLFDGQDLSRWHPTTWKLQDGFLEVTSGNLVTRDAFGDFQLHLEWMAPDPPEGPPMSRGNSGVLLMQRYELQIFDSYSEKLYADGQCAAIYGETPPLVNSSRKPGEWQSFDIVFQAPTFQGDQLKRRALITVFHNGVLVHHNTTIHGQMAHRDILPYEPHAARLPLALQGHGNPVRFRNIWIRPLD